MSNTSQELEIIFLVKARKELLNSYKWYEDKQPGLGSKFQYEIIRSLFLIKENPKHYPIRIVSLNLREIPVKIFPFLIIYKIDNDKKGIIVVSIFHTSRNPKKK